MIYELTRQFKIELCRPVGALILRFASSCYLGAAWRPPLLEIADRLFFFALCLLLFLPAVEDFGTVGIVLVGFVEGCP